MDHTPENDRSNPIARAFSRVFGRDEAGGTDAQARSTSDRPPRPMPGVHGDGADPRGNPATVGLAPGVTGDSPAVRTPMHPNPSSARGAPGGTHGSPSTAAPTLYTVAKGDTLSRIAQQVYGRSDRWTLIFEANRDRISSPDLIHPGQVLVLPDAEALH